MFITALHQPIRLLPGVRSKLISMEFMSREVAVTSTKLIAILPPMADASLHRSETTRCAKLGLGLVHRSKQQPYSITDELSPNLGDGRAGQAAAVVG